MVFDKSQKSPCGFNWRFSNKETTVKKIKIFWKFGGRLLLEMRLQLEILR